MSLSSHSKLKTSYHCPLLPSFPHQRANCLASRALRGSNRFQKRARAPDLAVASGQIIPFPRKSSVHWALGIPGLCPLIHPIATEKAHPHKAVRQGQPHHCRVPRRSKVDHAPCCQAMGTHHSNQPLRRSSLAHFGGRPSWLLPTTCGSLCTGSLVPHKTVFLTAAAGKVWGFSSSSKGHASSSGVVHRA